MAIKHLVKSGERIFTYRDKNWVNTGLSEEELLDENADVETLFTEYGFDLLDSVPADKWSELGDVFEIYTWTDDPQYSEDNPPKLELEVPEYRPYQLLENPVLLVYTDSEEVPVLEQTIQLQSKTRFLVSIDGVNYYANKGEGWIKIPKELILTEGMTKEEIESIPQEEWAALFQMEAYKHQFKILAGIVDETGNGHALRKITVHYAENEPPMVLSASLEPDSIHNEYVTLNAHIRDYEGDGIYYKILIKKAGEDEFYQASPMTEEWRYKGKADATIFEAFNHPYFNVGDNEIMLVVKDERGKETTWSGHVVLTNTDPVITITYDEFHLKATIGDPDSDKIAYRIAINGELVFDYTEFFPSPKTVHYVYDRDKIVFGQDNTIKIEAVDEFGGYTESEFTVPGVYRGLLFKNENGEYLVDGNGQILTDLIWDEPIIGGQVSDVKKVILENMHEFPVTNIVIAPENAQFLPGANLEISTTAFPFAPMDIIKIAENISPKGTKEFYVRVNTTPDAYQGGYFHIKAKANPVTE